MLQQLNLNLKCPCGSDLEICYKDVCFYEQETHAIHLIMKPERESKYMKTENGIEYLGKHLKVTEHPVVKKRKFSPTTALCIICGTKIINRCKVGPNSTLAFCFDYQSCIGYPKEVKSYKNWGKALEAAEYGIMKESIEHRNFLSFSGVLEAICLPVEPVMKYHKTIYPSMEDLSEMPMPCVSIPREYQLEIAVHSAQQNTIMYLQTGTGKTLVSVLLALQMNKLNPDKLIVFIVDRIPLMQQQTSYFLKETKFKILGLCGENHNSYSEIIHQGISNNYNLLVITAQMLYNLMRTGDIHCENCSLLIFDEIHHMKKDHPYQQIIQDFYRFCPVESKPLIFGMTASPISAASHNTLCTELRSLCSAIQATVYMPTHFEHVMKEYLWSAIAQWKTYENDLETIVFSNNLREQISLVLSVINNQSFAFDMSDAKLIGEIRKCQRNALISQNTYEITLAEHASRLFKAFESLELYSLKEISFNLKQYYSYLSSVGILKDHLESSSVAIFRKSLKESTERNLYSHKVHLLLEILKTEIIDDGFSKNAIVFVTKRDVAVAVAKIIAQVYPILCPTTLIGHNGYEGMSWEDEQKPALINFRSGRSRIMVATNVLEEGLDVPSCNLVIRFNGAMSFTAYVQSRGRARQQQSKFIIICEPNDESNELKMQATETAVYNIIKSNLMERNLVRSSTKDIVETLMKRVESSSRKTSCETLKHVPHQLHQGYDHLLPTETFILRVIEFDSQEEILNAFSKFSILEFDENTCLLALDRNNDTTIIEKYLEVSSELSLDKVTFLWNLQLSSSVVKEPSKESSVDMTGVEISFGNFSGTDLFRPIYSVPGCSLSCRDQQLLIDMELYRCVLEFKNIRREHCLCSTLGTASGYEVALLLIMETLPFWYSGNGRCVPPNTAGEANVLCVTLRIDRDNPAMHSLYQDLRQKLDRLDVTIYDFACSAKPIPALIRIDDLQDEERIFAMHTCLIKFSFLFPHGTVSEKLVEQLGEYLPRSWPDLIPSLTWPCINTCVSRLEQGIDFQKHFIDLTVIPIDHCDVRKLMVTPSRLMFVGRQVMLSNRIVRHFGADNFLVVAFCDEDGQKLSNENFLPRIHSVLKEGIRVGRSLYRFVGCSNNQLKCGNCWFTKLDIDLVRSWVGDFSGLKLPGKYLARLGLAFSATKQSIVLQETAVTIIDDVECNGFNFTDGVGTISQDTANNIMSSLGLERQASTFQIRYAGAKGVVFVSLKCPTKMCLRKSMIKFASDHNIVEICRVATTGPCFLNRQVIMLLSSLGIPDKVFMLLYKLDLKRRCDGQFTSRDLFPTNVYDLFKSTQGIFDHCTEPFLLGLRQAAYKNDIHQLLTKARIYIEKGCNLIGVADDTDTLNYGEVYVTYTDKSNNEIQRKVLKGKVVVYRNPCYHPGDILVLHAVGERKEFEHLYDTIVFPVRGPRPHANETGGGDLDGDIFSIIWDDRLFPPKTYPPMLYDQHTPASVKEISQDNLIAFYAKFQGLNDIGVFANAHCAIVDSSRYGAMDPKALKLAEMNAMVVDIAKTELRVIMPEEYKPKLYPDFMEKSESQSYQSDKVLGRIYRHCRGLWNDIRKAISTYIDVDDDFCVSGDLKETETIYNIYKQKMSAIMARYGLEHEFELFTKNSGKSPLSGNIEQVNIAVNQVQESFRKLFYHTIEDQEHIYQQKACMWYQTAYSDLSSNKFLSFPWVVSDVLVRRKQGLNKHLDRKNVACFAQNVNKQLLQFINRNQQELLGEYRERATFCARIKSLLATLDVNVSMFGSSALMLFHANSDVDLCVDHADGKPSMNLLNSILVPFFPDMIHVSTAAVPILKFQGYPISFDLTTDLSGLKKACVLQYYISQHAFIWPCLYFLVNWGRSCGLVATFNRTNIITSFGICWIFIQYCIDNDIVANIAGSPTEQLTECFWIELMEKINSYNKIFSSCGILLLDFLAYYGNCNSETLTIQDPVNSIPAVQLCKETLMIFKEKVNECIFMLSFHGGNVRAVLCCLDKESIIKLANILGERMASSPNWNIQKLLALVERKDLVNIQFEIVESPVRHYILKIQGPANLVEKIEEKVQKMTENLLFQGRNYDRPYYVPDSSLIMLEHSVIGTERLGFQSYVGETYEKYTGLTLHRPVLVAPVQGIMWESIGKMQFASKLEMQISRMNRHLVDSIDMNTVRMVVRYGTFLIVNLERIIALDSLGCVSIDTLVQSLDKAWAKNSNRWKRIETQPRENEKQTDSLPIVQPLTYTLNQAPLLPVKSIKPAKSQDRSIGNTFYNMVDISVEEIIKAVENENWRECQSEEVFTVHALYKRANFIFTTDLQGVVKTIHKNGARWLGATLISDKNENETAKDIRWLLESYCGSLTDQHELSSFTGKQILVFSNNKVTQMDSSFMAAVTKVTVVRKKCVTIFSHVAWPDWGLRLCQRTELLVNSAGSIRRNKKETEIEIQSKKFDSQEWVKQPPSQSRVITREFIEVGLSIWKCLNSIC